MFNWMAWTMPVAIFFICIFLMLCGMTYWEIKSPTSLRRGFLPIETTRGDRLFIGLLATAYINLAFVGLSGKLGQSIGMTTDPSIWISFIFSLLVLGYIMHKG
jgi:predicted small integral membrane protein